MLYLSWITPIPGPIIYTKGAGLAQFVAWTADLGVPSLIPTTTSVCP